MGADMHGSPGAWDRSPSQITEDAGPPGSCILEAKRVSARIGPDGGSLTLGAARLEIPPRTLERPTVIRLIRRPLEGVESSECDLRMMYTAEPFGLKARPTVPFVLYWSLQQAPPRMCPVISRTRDPDRLECYVSARPEDISRGLWSGRHEPCVEGGPRLDGRTVLLFSDRLGHFRLTSEYPIERGDDVGSEAAGACVPAPSGHDRRVYRLVVDGQVRGPYMWLAACQDSSDCDEGDFCAGACFPPRWGNCRSRPRECDDEPYRPVCGCDGRRYPNACEANRNGVALVTYARNGCEKPGK